MKNLQIFSRTFKQGVELEVKKGFAERGYASARVSLGSLPKKHLGDILVLLNEIAGQANIPERVKR